MNIGLSVAVFREDLSDIALPLGEISLSSIKASTSDIVQADFVIFVEQSNGDTKVLKNRYGHKGVVVPVSE